jgi:hypothetical protein
MAQKIILFKRFSSSPQCSDRLWGSPTLLFRGTGGEADHPLSSSAEVKNSGVQPLLHTDTWCDTWSIVNRDTFLPIHLPLTF